MTTSTTTTVEIPPRRFHPAATVWPMLSEAELWDLAADIAEHGQLDPILVNSDGEILDGRQREAACRLVGIEPQVSAYPGRPVCTRKIRGDADTPDHGPTGDGHGDPAE